MKKSSKLPVIAGLAFITLCSVTYLAFVRLMNDWNRDMEDLLTTMEADPSLYVEAGHGGDIPINVTPETWLPVGLPAQVNQLLVTVKESRPLTATAGLEPLGAGLVYWYLVVAIENTGPNESVWVRPAFDSRLQVMRTQGDTIRFEYTADDATTDRRMTETKELRPGENVIGWLIYRVPEEGDLYWFYRDSWDDRLVFKVRE